MKKLLALFLIAALLAPCALAEEIDLSGLTLDELYTLHTRIAKEIVTRPEWTEITIPAGLYKIGVDLPAGDWCIKCGQTRKDYIYVRYGCNMNESLTEIVFPLEHYGYVYTENNETERHFVNIKLIEGYYLEVSDGQFILCPQKPMIPDFE